MPSMPATMADGGRAIPYGRRLPPHETRGINDIGRAPDAEVSGDLHPAIDLVGLESVLTRAEPVVNRFHPHPSIIGAYLLEMDGQKTPVTFRRSILESHRTGNGADLRHTRP